MSFSAVWRDYNTQRDRRYHVCPKLIKLAWGYLPNYRKEMLLITESLERARQLKTFGFTLVGQQFDAEKQLSKDIRALMVHCHHHHALILKDAFREQEHDLLDAEAHMHVLQQLVVGTTRADFVKN